MPESAATSQTLPTARAARRAISQRQRRIARDLIVFVVTTFALVVIVGANRDRHNVNECRLQIEFAAKALTAELAADHQLPLALPLDAKSRIDRTHYNYAPVSLAVAEVDHDVPLVYCSAPHSLLTRRDGRHVAIKHGRTINVIWMTEREFEALSVRIGPRTRP